jgi:hypothetical protein
MKAKPWQAGELIAVGVLVTMAAALAISYLLNTDPQRTEIAISSATSQSSSDANQDDTHLIVEVVRNTLKCPIPVRSDRVFFDGIGGEEWEIYHVVNEFTGNATVFSVERRSVLISLSSSGPQSRQEMLYRVSIPMREFDSSEVTWYRQVAIKLVCHRGAECVDLRYQRSCRNEFAPERSLVGNVFQTCGSDGRADSLAAKQSEAYIHVCDRATASLLVEALTALRDRAR